MFSLKFVCICLAVLLSSCKGASLSINDIALSSRHHQEVTENNRFKRQNSFDWNIRPQSNRNRNSNRQGFYWEDPDENSISNERFGEIPQRIQSSTVAIPGMGTTRSPCEDACRATTQFDPICGTNGVTYTNIAWLRCAQRCGRNVRVKYPGSCPRFGK